GDAKAQRDDHQRDHYRDDGAAAAAAILARIVAARREAEREVPTTEGEIGGEGENAGENRRDHHHLRVAIADMRQLVAEHRLDLRVGQMIEQSARHRYAVIAVAQAAGEGVERAVLDDLQPRNRNAAGDAQILQQIIEPRRLRALYAGRTRGVVDHVLVKEICDAEPNARRAEGQRPALL